jgi:hypothetical protein
MYCTVRLIEQAIGRRRADLARLAATIFHETMCSAESTWPPHMRIGWGRSSMATVPELLERVARVK